MCDQYNLRNCPISQNLYNLKGIINKRSDITLIDSYIVQKLAGGGWFGHEICILTTYFGSKREKWMSKRLIILMLLNVDGQFIFLENWYIPSDSTCILTRDIPLTIHTLHLYGLYGVSEWVNKQQRRIVCAPALNFTRSTHRRKKGERRMP